jgi:hypothetical protein
MANNTLFLVIINSIDLQSVGIGQATRADEHTFGFGHGARKRWNDDETSTSPILASTESPIA